MNNSSMKYNVIIDKIIRNEIQFDDMTEENIKDIWHFVLSITDAIAEVSGDYELTLEKKSEALIAVCEKHKKWYGFDVSLLHSDIVRLITELQSNSLNSKHLSEIEHTVTKDVLNLQGIRNMYWSKAQV